MRLLSVFAGLLALTIVRAAKKKDAVTGDKVARLTMASRESANKGMIPLNDALYDTITSSPRNYSVLVLMTALDSRYKCQLCREFQPEYDLLAKSWAKDHRKVPGHGGLFFSTLDFNNGKETFKRLQLSTAPVLHLFLPTVGPLATANPSTPISYDFLGARHPAELVAKFISSNVKIPAPKIYRPFNWAKLATVLSSVVLAGTLLKVAWPRLAPILQNRNLWAAVTLILVLLFTSGHMFNHIRKVPYVAGDGKGGVSYIAAGFSNQYGLETQVVAVVYAVLAFGVISLAYKAPRIKQESRQKIAVWVWNVVILCAFSFLMSLFRVKNGSYPFFLPPWT